VSAIPDLENCLISAWITPASDDVELCVALEILGLHKRYMRIWPNAGGSVEYGWTLHPSAVQVWPPESAP
jgi:hypothetical protein